MAGAQPPSPHEAAAPNTPHLIGVASRAALGCVLLPLGGGVLLGRRRATELSGSAEAGTRDCSCSGPRGVALPFREPTTGAPGGGGKEAVVMVMVVVGEVVVPAPCQAWSVT